jgi:copper homeostasis protein
MMKKDFPMLEIIVCSVADAIAAEQGGATRLEVISGFELGGLTPALALVREISDTVKIPLRVMLRESVSFEVNDDSEHQRLCLKAREIAELAVDGMVLGFLRNQQIDVDLLEQILACAPNLRVTFHRAFEGLQNPFAGIATLKKYSQVDCILTSGGQADWSQKVSLLAQCAKAASPEISILVGGGVDFAAIEWLQKSTDIGAFHLGRAVRIPPELNGRVDAAKVREFARLIGLSSAKR